MKSLFSTKDPKVLNREYLDSHKNSLKATVEGAIVMYQLDNKTQKDALNLVTNIDMQKYNDVDYEVKNLKFCLFFVFWWTIWWLQICTDILNHLRGSTLGECGQSLIDDFIAFGQREFVHAPAFKPPQEVQPAQPQTNHVTDQDSNWLKIKGGGKS